MGEIVNIELTETKLQKLEILSKIASEREGKKIGVTDIIERAVDWHINKLKKEFSK